MDVKLYHKHHQQHTEDLPFWLKLAQNHSHPALELGCGTGRVLLPLQNAGLPIFGLDLDNDMLALLKAQSPGAVVFQADLTRFHLAKQFGFIFLACNTWTTLSVDQRESALAGITRHLQPDGVFAVSLPNPVALRSLEDSGEEEAEDDFTHPETGNPVLVSSAWQVWQEPGGQRRVTFYWHYDHLLPNGQSERTTHQANHWVTSASNYLAEFSRQGLMPKTYGDYDQSPYNYNQSPYFIILGQKV